MVLPTIPDQHLFEVDSPTEPLRKHKARKVVFNSQQEAMKSLVKKANQKKGKLENSVFSMFLQDQVDKSSAQAQIDALIEKYSFTAKKLDQTALEAQ